jgi:hypothetical protein
MSVITTVHDQGQDIFGLNNSVYSQFTLRIYDDKCSLYDKEIEYLLQDSEIRLLYQSLPTEFSEANAICGPRSDLTLQRAKKLVDYLLSDEFTSTMLGLYDKIEDLKEETTIGGPS